MDMGGGALLHPPESLRGHERREQHHHEHEHDRDDDLGPETSVDDGELQRQQLSDLDPAAEPRQEAPTPPAASLLPGQCEPDNVADSGEDSEDEWNYYKVDHTEKAVNVESLVQTKQPVCPQSAQLNLEGKSEDILDMESRLNPDAKEFVPSPTHPKPSFEDAIISQSPTGKILSFDNVEIPSLAQFQEEISLRPGEVSQDDALSNSGHLPDIQSDILNGGSIMDEELIKENDVGFKLTEQNMAVFASNKPFEVSVESSTKAVCGEELIKENDSLGFKLTEQNMAVFASNKPFEVSSTKAVCDEELIKENDGLGFKLTEENMAVFASNKPFEVFEGSSTKDVCDEELIKENDGLGFKLTEENMTVFASNKSFEVSEESSTKAVCGEELIKENDGLGFKLTEQNMAVFASNNPFEVSEASSTKAVCGDESVASFTTSISDILQKNLGTSASNVEGSFIETDFVASDTSGVKQSEDILEFEPSSAFKEFKKGLDNPLPTDFSPVKENGSISFELQKDIAPTMEECPERVKLTDNLINPFSHEQPIAEMPMEESEQLAENERTDLLNESFEHGPDFTLDAYEVRSPLNPCAPSFDYQNLDDNTDVHKVGETNESVGAVKGKLSDVSSDLASSVPISETILARTELTALDKDVCHSHHEKDLFPEVNDELEKISSFEQMEEYLNKSSLSEQSEKDVISRSSEVMCNFDQLSAEVVEKTDSVKARKFEEEICKRQTKLVGDKEIMDELNETSSDETSSEFMNDSRKRTTELVEPRTIECEVLQNPNVEPLEKSAAEPLEDLVKSAAEPSKFVDELYGDNVQLSDQLHREVNDLREDVKESGDENSKCLETITDLSDAHGVQRALSQRDAMKPNAVDSLELNSEMQMEQNITLENRLSFETASLPGETIQSKEPAPPGEQMTDNTSTFDLYSVPEALRVCVYPMPVDQSKLKDDVELISPSFESQEERREPLEKSSTHGAAIATGMKLESLSGEQRDMVETVLNEVSSKTELEEQNDLTSNADSNDVVLEELACHLNYVGGETEIAEKTEETSEKTVEKKEISTVEQKIGKPEAIDLKAISDETSKLSDADFSDLETISSGAVIEGERDRGVNKGEDEVPIITKTPPPTPTPASQAELISIDASEVKAESKVTGVAVAASVAGIAATTTGITTKKDLTSKKQTVSLTKDVKKTPVAKDSDKAKPGTKAPVRQSLGNAKVPTKTSPTSPTKLSVPSAPRTSTPKRTQVTPPATATKALAKTTTTTTAKPLRPTSAVANKPTSLATQRPSPTMGKVHASSIAPKPGMKAALPSTTKPSQTVRAASAPKPRVQSASTTMATKSSLANGDVKSTEVKKTSIATSKIAPRSHTAPTRMTIPKAAGTTTASVPKTGVQARTSSTSRTGMTNGIAQKSRVTLSTALSAKPAANHQTATDKQHKETTNKNISSRRIGTLPTKASPAKVGVKKSPPTAKGGKMPPAANGSPLISTGTGDEKKTDPLL